MAKKLKPDHLIVLGHKVPVTYHAQENMPESDTLGLFDANLPHIYILDNRQWRQTLAHELIHAILFYSGNSDHVGEQEEGLVTALEYGLKGHIKYMF